MKKKGTFKKMKGRSHKFKTKAVYAKEEKKPNKDVYNRADDGMEKMIGMNGSMGVKKYGFKKKGA